MVAIAEKKAEKKAVKKVEKKAVPKKAKPAGKKSQNKAPSGSNGKPAVKEAAKPVKVTGRGSMADPLPVRLVWVPENAEYKNGVKPELVPLEFGKDVSCVLGMIEGHIAAIVDHFEGVWYCVYFDLDLAPLAREAFDDPIKAREWLDSQELDRVLVCNTPR